MSDYCPTHAPAPGRPFEAGVTTDGLPAPAELITEHLPDPRPVSQIAATHCRPLHGRVSFRDPVIEGAAELVPMPAGRHTSNDISSKHRVQPARLQDARGGQSRPPHTIQTNHSRPGSRGGGAMMHRARTRPARRARTCNDCGLSAGNGQVVRRQTAGRRSHAAGVQRSWHK